MMSLDQKSDIKRLMAVFFFFLLMHFSVGNSIKLMSRNSHFGCLLIPGARRSASDW